MGTLPIRGMMHPAANKSIKNTQKNTKTNDHSKAMPNAWCLGAGH